MTSDKVHFTYMISDIKDTLSLANDLLFSFLTVTYSQQPFWSLFISKCSIPFLWFAM